MDNYRNKPKGTFNQQVKATELYALTQCWKSDLEFYKKDLDFLNKLIDNYFIWIAEKEHIDMVSGILRLACWKSENNVLTCWKK